MTALLLELRQGQVLQVAVRAHFVVVPAPGLDDNLGLAARAERLDGQALPGVLADDGRAPEEALLAPTPGCLIGEAMGVGVSWIRIDPNQVFPNLTADLLSGYVIDHSSTCNAAVQGPIEVNARRDGAFGFR